MEINEYYAQNALGFEGDTIFKQTVKNIIEDKKIETAIETGTYRGGTTAQLAQMVKKVYTIELVLDNYMYAKETYSCKHPNIHWNIGNSADILKIVLQNVVNEYKQKKLDPNNLFIFLDAHWEAYNPLLEELKTIASFGIKPFIAIHDFKVPNNPELGYDVYGNIVYEWNWIEKDIENIYGAGGFDYFYNNEATGAKRGVIFIHSK